MGGKKEVQGGKGRYREVKKGKTGRDFAINQL
jgi:hypothetical protein